MPDSRLLNYTCRETCFVVCIGGINIHPCGVEDGRYCVHHNPARYRFEVTVLGTREGGRGGEGTELRNGDLGEER